MKNKLGLITLFSLLSSCTLLSKGSGQVVFHWEKPNTGIQAFSIDHNKCMQHAKDFKFIPDFRSWFYSEEAKLNTRADWHSSKGIWASYIAYPGAQPIMVNSIKKDNDVDPKSYKNCMVKKGYTSRHHTKPEITNINVQDKYRFND